MSISSKVSLDSAWLSHDLKIPTVSHSGWPPPSVLIRKEIIANNLLSDTTTTTAAHDSSNVTSILKEKSCNDEQRSREIKTKTFFDKLLHVARERHQSNLTSGSMSSLSVDQLADGLESFIESIEISKIWNFDDSKTNKSQEEILLAELKKLKEIYLKNSLINSIAREQLVKRRVLIHTLDGDVHFDFFEQSIGDDIYLRLMQLVRLSNLDKLIEKIFHKSGEYHDIDYKKHRHNQLENDQENHSIKTEKTDLAHLSLTMARAVHFRALSHYFELDDVDISSRFQYDRNILHDTCLRFHAGVDINLNTPEKTKQTNLQFNIHRILVLCSCQMKEIYQSLNLLFESYKSPNISIFYVTFDQLEAILTKSKQISSETVQDDLTDQEITSYQFNNWNMNNDNTQSITLEENNQMTCSDDNFVSDSFRTSSLVLIMMKHLDETYLNKLIQWYYTIHQLNTGLQLPTDWDEFLKHWWLITSDYQHAKTVYNISETNLFLWPTKHDNFDNTSIILSSILALPIALSINYNIYSMIIDGMSTIDKHCQEVALDRNICIQMALLRIWSSIGERRKTTTTTAIIICDDDLRYFSKYVRILFTEYDGISQNKMVDNYTSVHGTLSAKRFFEQEFNEKNHISCDIISINEQKLFSWMIDTLQTTTLSFPHTRILLDQVTPLTVGVLMSTYHMSIFFENFIRNELNITFDPDQ